MTEILEELVILTFVYREVSEIFQQLNLLENHLPLIGLTGK